MSILNRIVSTARGAAARGGTSTRGGASGRRPAAGGRRSPGNAAAEKGVRTAINVLRRRR